MIHTRVEQFLYEDLPSLHIAVIGDVMVDRYVYGTVSRISPEAPVPVNRVQSIEATLGGAANVAANLANMDCHTHLCGMVGCDEYGEELARMVQEKGIDFSGALCKKGHATTTKLRVLGGRQQMLRLDFEEVLEATMEEVEQTLLWLKGLAATRLDGIILSDYGKGMITEEMAQGVIAFGKIKKIPVLVDPKGADWTKYKGATFITPNVKELCECVGHSIENETAPIVEAGEAVRRQYELETLVVTRSEKGISAIQSNGKSWYNPATAQEVFDVSGAGDTVAAMIIAAYAGGLSMRSVLQAANYAASIGVAKVGTYAVHRQELIDLWLKIKDRKWKPYAALSWEAMKQLVDSWKEKGETVVFTNGCFDILHRGHVLYLQQAAALGDHLIIGLNSDASVKRLKGDTRPLVQEEDRAVLLSALGCVSEVVIFDQDTPYELLSLLEPDILVKGGDYAVEDVVGREFAKKVEIIPFETGYSTTGIVKKIAALAKENRI